MNGITKRNLSDLVAESIVDFIVENNLKPGDAIPTEKEIADRFKIGKTSVREGVAKLKSLGVLESHQGGRIFVKELCVASLLKPRSDIALFRLIRISQQEELDLIHLRQIIESAALERAMQRDPGELTRTLRSLMKNMGENRDEVEQYITFDVAFHEAIITASGNSILSIIFQFINDLYNRQFHDSARLAGEIEPALKAHRRILEAVESGDTVRARSRLNEHLEETASQILSNRGDQPGSEVQPCAGDQPGLETRGGSGPQESSGRVGSEGAGPGRRDFGSDNT